MIFQGNRLFSGLEQMPASRGSRDVAECYWQITLLQGKLGNLPICYHHKIIQKILKNPRPVDN